MISRLARAGFFCLFVLAPRWSPANASLPMKVHSCKARVTYGTIVFTLDYSEAAPLPEALVVVTLIESPKGTVQLDVHHKKKARLILVKKSEQVLFNSEGLVLEKAGKKGRLTFKLPESASGIYDIGGRQGLAHITIREDKDEGARVLGDCALPEMTF
jgi:hypothetical protein